MKPATTQPNNALLPYWQVVCKAGQYVIVHSVEPWEIWPTFDSYLGAAEICTSICSGKIGYRNIPMVPLGTAIPRVSDE